MESWTHSVKRSMKPFHALKRPPLSSFLSTFAYIDITYCYCMFNCFFLQIDRFGILFAFKDWELALKH